MKMKMHHRIDSIVWIMIGTYVAVHSYQLGLGNFRHPGPGLLFFLVALFLIILVIIDLAGTSIGKRRTDKDKGEHSVWVGIQWQKVLLVIGGLSAYVFFFNTLGFLLSTFLLMFFLFKVVEPTKWWVAMVSSLLTILICYGLFKVCLEVSLPAGFLGF